MPFQGVGDEPRAASFLSRHDAQEGPKPGPGDPRAGQTARGRRPAGPKRLRALLGGLVATLLNLLATLIITRVPPFGRQK